MVGIRLRLCDGRKLAVKGGKEGLFICDDLRPDGRLVICEGPTDTAALLDLGFPAIGRPSCNGGMKQLVALIGRLDVDEAVIVADADGPGRRGAESLAGVLVAYTASVRMITPPDGINDARAWKQAGVTKADVDNAIEAVAARKLKIEALKAGNR